MRILRLCPVMVLAGLLLSGMAQAREPYKEFIQGLRQRELFDIADLYLVKIEGQPDTPEDIRVVIPYERALTLLAWSRTQRNPEDQAKMLDQAEAHLEQFTKANPQHPLAGEASTERARMLLARARVEIWKSRAPANQGNRREFQQNARGMVTKAREIFKAAHDLHKAAYDKFPGFIDQQEDRQLFEERRTAEVKYIRAQLDMALCTYELAQTYDEGSEEFRSTLTKASTEFEDIHTKYRSQVGGLYARMWQGKCFEEQDEIGKALGIYNELLEHPGKSDTLRRLQDQVRQFRLICLNHEQRKDYELVRIEAGDWLKDNRRASPIHMGIRWERARALESLGDAKATEPAEALRYYRLARTDAEYLARFDGQYRDVAQAMFQRMEVHLKDDPGDPTTFDQASAMGRSLVKQIKPLKDSVSAEKDPAKKAELQLKYDDHVIEAARMLNLALKLSDEETKITQVNSVRYQLAYVYYLLRESYRAAILGEFVGQHYAVEDSTTAQDSAYIALAAWMQAYNDATKDRSRGEGESAAGAEPPGQTELRRMLRVSELITETWPQSDRANDARMTLGNVYSRLKEPVQAAKWFQQVPATAAQYPDAQEAAGQAYWSAWLEAARLDEASRPAAAELDAWQASARSHLSTAIDQLSKQVPEGGQPSPGLIAAKVSLSQILISQGEYQTAIELLTQDPHSPSKAIQVEEGKPRPRVGVTSRDFASLTYQQLLRAYVGVQQIDPALQVMQKLEELGGGDDGGVMQIYVNLGQELEKEIRRLRELNQTDRLTTVRESFDKFLNELFNRRDQMNYNALVWIAETYNSLGTGMGEDSGATAYFEKAANTYADILTRAEQDPNFTSVSLSGVRLRLVTCRRRQQNFEEALNLVAVILKEKPRALDAQFEAAQIYQDWGASGQPEAWKHYHTAITGPAEGDLKEVIWGWATIANQIQRLVSAGVANATHKRQFVTARYNAALCRFYYGFNQSTTALKKEELEKVLTEIDAFNAIAGPLMDDEWFPQFSELYLRTQKELDPLAQPVPLERKEIIAETNIPGPPLNRDDEVAVAEEPEVAAKPAAPPAPPNYTLIFAGLLIAVVVVGGGAFYMMKSQKRGRRVAYGAAPPAALPAGIGATRSRKSAGSAPAARKRTAAAGKRPAAAAPGQKPAAPKQPGQKPTAQKTAGQKPAGKPAAGSASAAQKQAQARRKAAQRQPRPEGDQGNA